METPSEKLVPILSGAESEAFIVKGILDENDIPSQIRSETDLPSVCRFLGFEVLVPEHLEGEARRVIAEATAEAASRPETGN